MGEASFHSRANAVRAESRMLMRKLRAERLASSRHRVVPTPPIQVPPSEPVSKAHSAASTTILPSRKVKAAVAPPIDDAPAAPTQKTRKTKMPVPNDEQPPLPVEAASSDALEEKAAKPRRKPSTTRQSKAAPLAATEAYLPVKPDQATPDLCEPEVRSADPRPLSTIPALGPGMIWRLNQIGLKNVGDLANADAERLRTSLGGIAKLIRVENLIALARASNA